jgi:hypothetical protein
MKRSRFTVTLQDENGKTHPVTILAMEADHASGYAAKQVRSRSGQTMTVVSVAKAARKVSAR